MLGFNAIRVAFAFDDTWGINSPTVNWTSTCEVKPPSFTPDTFLAMLVIILLPWWYLEGLRAPPPPPPTPLIFLKSACRMYLQMHSSYPGPNQIDANVYHYITSPSPPPRHPQQFRHFY